jgi:ABC-type oligopeptide transport system substrate-binding subunit
MDNLIKSWVWLLGFTLITFVSIAGCSKGQSNVEKGNKHGILHWGNGTDPQELDPHIVTGVPEHHILSAVLVTIHRFTSHCNHVTISTPLHPPHSLELHVIPPLHSNQVTP